MSNYIYVNAVSSHEVVTGSKGILHMNLKSNTKYQVIEPVNGQYRVGHHRVPKGQLTAAELRLLPRAYAVILDLLTDVDECPTCRWEMKPGSKHKEGCFIGQFLDDTMAELKKEAKR